MNGTHISESAPRGATLPSIGRLRQSMARSNRLAWTLGGVAFLVVNEVFSLSNLDGTAALPVGARIGAVLCLLAAFIVHMMEPQSSK